MNRCFRTLLALGLMAFAPLAWCADKIPVVASFSILGDIVSVVGGDRVVVTSLVGPDQDAHVFEPTPVDVKKVAQAHMVVINGLGFEGWIARLAKSAGYRKEIVVASAGVRARTMSAEEGHGRQTDPHAWQDPNNVIVYVRNIAEKLAALDPAGAAEYRANSQRYIAELTKLDEWIVAQYAQTPATRRRIITSHDAFGYHGARYGIELLAPQGMSTESEASAKDVANLIRQIRREHIKAVFMENMSNAKLISQLARDAGVTLAGELYPDALSKADGPAPTYLNLMRYNVNQIAEAMKKN
ncbi:MAG: periplasmic solute binding family protein [Proteobacteria bacterium]|nr:periplasmic solute binding family protein [Pseudomonadota bacterium]